MRRDVICVFPGQGSQYPGMGLSVIEKFPEFSVVLEEASDTLSLNFKELLASDESTLKITYNAQPCLLIVSVLYYQVLRSRLGITPVMFAGHSLGEYSALCASERLAFESAVRLVRKRGELMQKAVPLGTGGMLAIVGSYPDIDFDKLCSEHSTSTSYVAVANYNSPQQIVVSGHLSAIESLSKTLSSMSVKAIPLSVSAPFHSKLMVEAKEGLRPYLLDTTLKESSSFIAPNVTGTIQTSYKIDYLIDQIDSAVLWTQTNKAIEQKFMSSTNSNLETESHTSPIYVEVGSGKVLSNLAKRSFPKTLKIVTTDNLESSITELEQLLS